MSRKNKVRNDREVSLRLARRGRHWRLFVAIVVFISVSIITNNYIHPLGLGPTYERYRLRFIEASADHGLVIKNIVVRGRQFTSADDILSTMGHPQHQPMLLFSPQETKRQLETLPWIREAVVKRQFPDTILIQLQERRPIALWQQDKHVKLIDETGTVIPVNDWTSFQNLPLVAGLAAPAHTAAILKVIAQHPDMAVRVRGLGFVSQRRWDVYMSSGVVIKLPEYDPSHAWAIARDLYALSTPEQHLQSIDLRLPDKAYVKWSQPKHVEARYLQKGSL